MFQLYVDGRMYEYVKERGGGGEEDKSKRSEEESPQYYAYCHCEGSSLRLLLLAGPLFTMQTLLL